MPQLKYERKGNWCEGNVELERRISEKANILEIKTRSVFIVVQKTEDAQTLSHFLSVFSSVKRGYLR